MEPYLDADGNELPSDGYGPLSHDLRWLTPEETERGRWYDVNEALPFVEKCSHEKFRGPGGWDRAPGDKDFCHCRVSRDVLVKDYDGRTKAVRSVRYLRRMHGVRVGSGAMTTSYAWYPNGLPVCNSMAWMELPD